MLSTADCINATPGSFNDVPPPQGEEDTGGGGGNVGPAVPAGGQTETDPPTGGGPPPPPNTPSIDIPTTLVISPPPLIIGCMDPLADNFNADANIPCVGCCDYGEGGTGTGGGSTSEGLVDTPATMTVTFPIPEFLLYNIPTNLGETKHLCTVANGSISQAAAILPLGVGELDVGGAGDFGQIPGGSVEAALIDLPFFDSSVPSIRITVPTDLDSLQYYAEQARTGNIVGSFDILYVIDPPGEPTDYIEFYRHHVFFTSELTVQVDTIENEDPSIVYPNEPLIIHAHAPNNSNPSVASPSQFELNGNSIANIKVTTLPLASQYADYISVDNQGNITTNSFGDFAEIAPTPITITVVYEFDFSPDITIEFPVEIIDDDPQPPNFVLGDSGIVYYGDNAPQSVIDPIAWDNNGNNVIHWDVMQVAVFPQGCDPEGVCWPSNAGGTAHPELILDTYTGRITLLPWNTTQPLTYPGDLHVILSWNTFIAPNNPQFEGFIDVVIPISYVAALTSDGPGDDTVTVVNKDTGTKLRLPKNYSALRGTKRVSNKSVRGPRTIGASTRSKGVLRITTREVATSEKIKQRLSTSYYDGLRDPNFTFFNTVTPSQNIITPYNDINEYYVTGSAPNRSVLSQKGVDFVVANVVGINTKPFLYNDFSYNALTDDKVKRSLSTRALKGLTQATAIDGSPYLDKIATNIKTAIISNELPRYSEEDVLQLASTSRGVSVPLSPHTAVNQEKAFDIMVNKSASLDLNAYPNIANKNRMLNWKSLAEDLNKNIKLKTADGVETPLYIPNSEVISVYDSTGGSHELTMQDGDYFTAITLSKENRLTVYSDREKARVLSPANIATASRLLRSDVYMDLTCTSIDSSLIELDVDTTGVRQDYYFLSLDKKTIEDGVPDGIGVRKTTATYNYITSTSEIDEYVKHKAFPYLTVYIRDDDIIFNHLESSLTAQVTFNEPSLEYLTNMDQLILARRMPWYLLVIPTDVTDNLESQTRSVMNNFSSRTLSLGFTSNRMNTDQALRDNRFLTESIATTGGINFEGDRIGRVIYQEAREYSINFTALTDSYKYRTGAEIVPRKLHPTNAVLKKLNEIKDEFSLTTRDSIKSYDLFSRLSPSEFRGLNLDQESTQNFYNKLRVNKVTDSTAINEEKFVSVKEVSVRPQTVVDVLPKDAGGVVFTKQPTAAAAPDPVTAPEERPTGPVATP